jgi:hypothetical protein
VGFIREAAAKAGRSGIAILSAASTVLPVGVYLLSQELSWAIAIALAVLFLAALGAAHEFWKERNEADEKREAIEETPEFQIDKVLKEGLSLRESLTHNGHGFSEAELRDQTVEFITEVMIVVRAYAPAHTDDLQPELFDGSGIEHFLNIVNENFRVLAEVRKQL